MVMMAGGGAMGGVVRGLGKGIRLLALLSFLAASGRSVAADQEGNGKLAIDVRIVGIDGQPISERSTVTVWEKVETASEAEPRAYTWTDTQNGTLWRRVTSSNLRNTKDRFRTHSDLRPGVYLVTAFVGSSRDRMLGMAVSKPITLDGTEKTTLASISIQEGPATTLTILDRETGEPVAYPRPSIRLTRSDGLDAAPYPFKGSLNPADDGSFQIEHLAPGSYQLDVSAQTRSYGYPDYSLPEPIRFDVLPDQPTDVVANVVAHSIDESEAKKRWAWAAEGKVTDDHGEPLLGVEIRAASGWGTMFPSMPVFTGADGRYLIRFRLGRMGGNGVQCAIISARKEGYAERNLGRQGRLLAGPELPDDKSYSDQRVILPNKPCNIDFTMLPLPAVHGLLLDEAGKPLAGKGLSLQGDQSPSGTGGATTDNEGRFQLNQVPPGLPWWLLLADKELALPRTQPFTLLPAEEYHLVLRIVPQDDYHMLRIESLKGSKDCDVLAEVVGDDLRARPFVDAETAARAHEILDRMAHVNRRWFSSPKTDGTSDTGVNSFSYTFQFANGESQEITYDDYLNAKSWYREWYPKGISYTGAARVLSTLRDRVRFRDVQIDDEEVSIYFVLDRRSTVAAGNGVAGSWSGFSQGAVKEGRIKIDAERFTPISLEYEERREEYGDYVQISPDCYVPLSVQIDGKQHYRWQFRVWKPGLWLFDSSAGETEPIAWIINVAINGQPGECMAQLDK
jgi:hypothetical protein